MIANPNAAYKPRPINCCVVGASMTFHHSAAAIPTTTSEIPCPNATSARCDKSRSPTETADHTACASEGVCVLVDGAAVS